MRKTISLILVAFLFSSCSKEPEPVSLSLKLERGFKRTVVLTEEGTTSVHLKEGDLNADVKSEIVLKLKVDDVGATGAMTMTVTFDDLSQTETVNVGGQVIVSPFQTIEGTTYLQQVYDLMKGKSFVIEVQPDASISRIEGADSIREELNEETVLHDMARFSERWTEKKKREHMDGFLDAFNEDGLRTTVENFLVTLPEHEVKVNDSWQSDTGSGDLVESHNTITLQDAGQYFANLSIQSTISAKENDEGTMVSGKGQAQVQIDKSNGFIKKGKGTVSYETNSYSAEYAMTTIINNEFTLTIETLDF